jgi:hypothetical protein
MDIINDGILGTPAEFKDVYHSKITAGLKKGGKF